MSIEKNIHGKVDSGNHVGRRSNVLSEQRADYQLVTSLDDLQDIGWSRQLVGFLPDGPLREWHLKRLEHWDKQLKP